MMNLFFAAAVTFIYSIETGKTYEACYQEDGTLNVVCEGMETSPHIVEVRDGGLYDFFVKVDDVESDKVRYQTQEKKPPAPVLSVN